MDVEREREDGEGGEEDEGVDEDGLAVGVEAAEVDVAVGARQLAEQARREQHEQHHAHHHGAPVRHVSPSRRSDPRSHQTRSRSRVAGERECGEETRRGGVWSGLWICGGETRVEYGSRQEPDALAHRAPPTAHRRTVYW